MNGVLQNFCFLFLGLFLEAALDWLVEKYDWRPKPKKAKPTMILSKTKAGKLVLTQIKEHNAH